MHLKHAACDDAACEHALPKLTRPRDDFGLFAVKAERSGIENRCIQNDSVDRSGALACLYRHHAVTCFAAT